MLLAATLKKSSNKTFVVFLCQPLGAIWDPDWRWCKSGSFKFCPNAYARIGKFQRFTIGTEADLGLAMSNMSIFQGRLPTQQTGFPVPQCARLARQARLVQFAWASGSTETQKTKATGAFKKEHIVNFVYFPHRIRSKQTMEKSESQAPHRRFGPSVRPVVWDPVGAIVLPERLHFCTEAKGCKACTSCQGFVISSFWAALAYSAN